jgi:hypothetical protein
VVVAEAALLLLQRPQAAEAVTAAVTAAVTVAVLLAVVAEEEVPLLPRADLVAVGAVLLAVMAVKEAAASVAAMEELPPLQHLLAVAVPRHPRAVAVTEAAALVVVAVLMPFQRPLGSPQGVAVTEVAVEPSPLRPQGVVVTEALAETVAAVAL